MKQGMDRRNGVHPRLAPALPFLLVISRHHQFPPGLLLFDIANNIDTQPLHRRPLPPLFVSP